LPPHPKLIHTQADLRETPAQRALAGVDVLYHLGYQLWRSGGRNQLDGVNLDGTRNILRAKPGRVVFASSAAVYGAHPDNALPLSETSPTRPNEECPYAADKLASERLCADAAPAAVLRICAVLGPNSDPRVRRSAKGYKLTVPAVTGATQALQFLYEDDAAAALHRAGTAAATGVFNVATDDWLAEEDIANLAGGRVLRLPLKVVLGVSEAAVRLKLMPFGADRACMLNGPLALSPVMANEVLGWRSKRRSDEVLKEFIGRK
jgi:nucleoside-diphosphate-sugar epimerase